MSPASEPALYGLTAENNNRSSAANKSLWGKNSFNATFPLALCLYMRDQTLAPVAVVVTPSSEPNDQSAVAAKPGVWTMDDVVGDTKWKHTFYDFETGFAPYRDLVRNTTQDDGASTKIDLVVSNSDGPWRPLEIKLTVVPDKGTAGKPEERWAPELVIRPITSAYAMLGLATSLSEPRNAIARQQVLDLLQPVYDGVSSTGWDNVTEMLTHRQALVDALERVIQATTQLQSPFLVQPTWKTKGQSFALAEMCFDVHVWSDVAILKLTVDRAAHSMGKTVTRPQRDVARHVRALHDLLSRGRFDYVAGNRYSSPRVSRDLLREVILNGGERRLKPERRLDAAIVYHLRSET